MENPTDQGILAELEQMERFIRTMKAQLQAAQTDNPAVRFGAAFELRCTHTALRCASDLLIMEMDRQNAETRAAFEAWRQPGRTA